MVILQGVTFVVSTTTKSCNIFGTNTNRRNNNKIKGGIHSIYLSENTRQLQGQRLIGQVYSHVHRHTKSIKLYVWTSVKVDLR